MSAQNAHIHFKQGSLSLATTSQRTKMGAVPASPIAGISIRLARRILDLAFVEMCDFLSDCWQEEAQQLLVLDPLQLVAPRRLSRKASVQDIGLWIECFSWMAAVLVSTRLQRCSHTRHPSSDVTELRGQLVGGVRPSISTRGCCQLGISIGSGGLARGAGGANAPPRPPPADPKKGGAKTATGRQNTYQRNFRSLRL